MLENVLVNRELYCYFYRVFTDCMFCEELPGGSEKILQYKYCLKEGE